MVIGLWGMPIGGGCEPGMLGGCMLGLGGMMGGCVCGIKLPGIDPGGADAPAGGAAWGSAGSEDDPDPIFASFTTLR